MALVQIRASSASVEFSGQLDPLISLNITTPLGIIMTQFITNGVNFQFFFPVGATIAFIEPDPVSTAGATAGSSYSLKGIAGDVGCAIRFPQPCMFSINPTTVNFFVFCTGLTNLPGGGAMFTVTYL